MRAFVRDPARLPDHLRDSVEVVQGDVLNYTDVLNAIKNVTAVVVALGTRNDLKPTTLLSDGMKNIVRAMKELNVEIVSACLSAFLFLEEDKVPAVFKDISADHRREYAELKESGLKYVAVLPPHIAGEWELLDLREQLIVCPVLDQPGNKYDISIDSPSARRVVSKHDLGRFLIDCLTQPEYYRKTCGICTIYGE